MIDLNHKCTQIILIVSNIQTWNLDLQPSFNTSEIKIQLLLCYNLWSYKPLLWTSSTIKSIQSTNYILGANNKSSSFRLWPFHASDNITFFLMHPSLTISHHHYGKHEKLSKLQYFIPWNSAQHLFPIRDVSNFSREALWCNLETWKYAYLYMITTSDFKY